MDQSGPFLTAAILCEKILREVDGVPTIVRAFDAIEYHAEGPGIPEGAAFSFVVFVVIRGGTKTGNFVLKMQLVNPSGTRAPEWTGPFHLDGPGTGHNFNVQLTGRILEDGVHWLELSVGDGGPSTRVPFNVARRQS